MDIKVKQHADGIGRKLYDISTSWLAILFFSLLCTTWAVFNTLGITAAYHFDPYPFNNLRLLLSFIGAIQAPLLLTYSRKSTEHRRAILEKDFLITQKTLKKVKWLKKHIKEKQNGKSN